MAQALPPPHASTFGHRTGRIIAVTRLLLIILVALWVSLDREQPVHGGKLAYAVFAAYGVYALALVWIAWRDWWLEYHLTWPSYLADSALFISSLYFTEEVSNDFVSPNIAFFIFLAVLATLRWNRGTAITILVGLCYLAGGILLIVMGMPIDLQVLLRRVSYLLIIGWLLGLFISRGQMGVPRLAGYRSDADAAPWQVLLDQTIALVGARGGALIWSAAEEPAQVIALSGRVPHLADNIDPLIAAEADEPAVLLFDIPRRRFLALLDDGRTISRRNPEIAAAEAALGIPRGLSFTVDGHAGRGRMILSDHDSPCPDDLELGRALGQDLTAAISQHASQQAARQSALTRLRGSLARDLHDSVSQSLAGASYRLGTLQRKAASGQDVASELATVAQSLAEEQQYVRAIIERLRLNDMPPGQRALAAELPPLVAMLERQWNIPIALDLPAEPLALPVAVLFDVQQIIREGVANAARHGQASHVSLSMRPGRGELYLVIRDDGLGLPGEVRPRSIAERIEALGGNLVVTSSRGDTRLTLTIPQKASR